MLLGDADAATFSAAPGLAAMTSDDLRDEAARREWTQHDLDLLHDMVRDYDRARWLRGQLKWWALWVLGLPTGAVSVWKAIEELLHLIKGPHG